MSRNKDIEFLHKISGKSYKECRKIMKRYHWQLGLALFPVSDPETWLCLMDSAARALNALAEATFNVIDNVVDVLKKIDWEKISKAISEEVDK